VKVVPKLRGHTREFEEACRGVDGKRAVLTGSKALCLTALDLLASPEEMEKVKRSFEERRDCFE